MDFHDRDDWTNAKECGRLRYHIFIFLHDNFNGFFVQELIPALFSTCKTLLTGFAYIK